MRNEKGFIFPTTVVIVLFCLLIVAHISTALINEKQFYSETKQYYVLENLMQLAVDQSLLEIKNATPNINESSTTSTINGSFTYTVKEISAGIYEIDITCKSTKNREYTAKYQYDNMKNEIINWFEY